LCEWRVERGERRVERGEGRGSGDCSSALGACDCPLSCPSLSLSWFLIPLTRSYPRCFSPYLPLPPSPSPGPLPHASLHVTQLTN
jgi:hypothetical protein